MSDILDRGLTHAQMRERLLRQDRAQWFAGTHANGQFGIISRKGREVARCESLDDRDFLLRAAQAHDELINALHVMRDIWGDHSYQCAYFKDYTKNCDCNWPSVATQCDRALSRARGEQEPPATPENVSGGGCP